jgi:hypothetical protein
VIGLGGRSSRGLAAAAALAWILAGCARATQVVPVRIDPDVAPGRALRSVRGYESAIHGIARLMVAELRLPLPSRLTVFVYPTRIEFERGLAREMDLPPARAAMIADSAVGLGQARRVFINDEALRGVPRRAWLGLVAHELTHVAQYELAGGRRGRSEQWLREGMADWVAAWILERLGEASTHEWRQRALGAVAAVGTDARHGPSNLVVLGHPRGWKGRLLAAGRAPTYGVAFLLTDGLVRDHGLNGLIAYFRAFAESDDRFEHFRRAFGESLGEFERRALDRIRREAHTLPRVVECDGFSAPAATSEVLPLDVLERCVRNLD